MRGHSGGYQCQGEYSDCRQDHDQGIERTHVKKKRLENARNGRRSDEAENAADGGEFEAGSENEAHDVRALRAQGHADGHLLHA